MAQRQKLSPSRQSQHKKCKPSRHDQRRRRLKQANPDRQNTERATFPLVGGLAAAVVKMIRRRGSQAASFATVTIGSRWRGWRSIRSGA